MTSRREEFEGYGFRWPAETEVRLPDGTTATIVPTFYLRSRESRAPTERHRKFLRLYRVSLSDGRGFNDLEEIRVERLLGEDPDVSDA